MSSSMYLSMPSSMSSSMSSIPVNTTEATKLRKKSIIKQIGGDVKAKALWKTVMEAHADRKLKLMSEVSRVGGDTGFYEGLRSWKTKIKVEVDRKLESEVSELKNELGKRRDDESLEGMVNGNEMGLDEIPGFLKGCSMGMSWVGEKEIEKLANGIVDKEIEKSTAKALWLTIVNCESCGEWFGRVDYEVASGGASVKKHSEAYVGRSGACRVTEWLKGRSVRGDSVKVLQERVGLLS
uniref:Uncharacterized protein n=1 Tax=Tanacetum cinerariifolium TaxID=118510 RepID=A0A6L2LNX0_TANCI|nr:hypothetical protein [Tanacetum cinerariifolium]